MADLLKDIPRPKESRIKKLLRQIFWSKGTLVFVLYLGIAIAFTYPLILNPTTHISGDGGDGPIFVWNAWWFDKAFSDNSVSLIYTDYLNYPDGLDLLFHTHTYVHDALINLLEPLFGLIASFNIVLLLAMTLAAMGMYMLANSIVKNRIAAFIAGIVFAFAPCIFVRSLGHFNLAAVWPIPWFFYFFFQALKTKKFRWAIPAGVVYGISILNGFHYPLYILLFGFIALVAQAIFSAKSFFTKDTVAVILVMIAVAVAIALPLFVEYFAAYLGNNAPAKPPLSDYDGYSADFVRFFIPSFLHPWLGDLALKINTTFADQGGGIENTVFMGYTVILLSLLATFLVRGKLKKSNKQKSVLNHPWFWSFFLIIAFLLALGPSLTMLGDQQFNIFGQARQIKLPYQWLWHLPIIGGLRVPSRFAVMVMFAAAVLVAICLAWFLKFIKDKINWEKSATFLLAIVCAGLILFEFLPAPFSTNDLSLPDAYADKIPPDGTALNMPFGMTSGFRKIGRLYPIYQYAQAVHQRPIVSGYVSRIPNENFDELTRTPGLKFLLEYPRLRGELADFSKKQVAEVIKEKNIKTVIIHKYQYRLNHPDVITILQKYIEEVMDGEIITEEGSDIFYSIPFLQDSAEDNVKEKVLPTLGTQKKGETVENELLPKRVASALAKSTSSSLGLVHLDAFKDGIPQGKVNRLDIVKAYPWTDNIVTAEISREDFRLLAESGKFGYSNYSTLSDKIKIAFPEYLLSTESYFNQIDLEEVELTGIEVVDSIINSYQHN